MNIERVVKSISKSLDEDRAALRAALEAEPNPPGIVRPDDSTFMEWVMAMMRQYPPQQFTTPEGRVVNESPWILMLSLPNVAGGAEILKRINRIRQKAVQ